MSGLASVYVTCPDLASARTIATSVVESGHAACANMLGAESIYRWNGETVRDPEVVMFLKTTVERVPALIEAIRAQHPAEVPCIVALPALDAHAPYALWVREQVAAGER